MIIPIRVNQSFILDSNVKVVAKLSQNASCKGCYFNSYNRCATYKYHSKEVICRVFDAHSGTTFSYIYESIND